MKMITTQKFLTASLAACLLFGVTACKTTRQVSKESYNEPSGFLGDYAQMWPGTNGQANLVYIKSGVDWAKYTKIWIKPVELWKSDDPESRLGKMSDENRQKLIDLYHTAMYNTLSTNYTMVEQGGPDVLIIRAAITDARKGKPVAGTISSIYLPLKLISVCKQGLAGTAIGVGSVTIEAEMLDGANNERLCAVLDTRSGTTAIRSKFSGSFADIEKSFACWAERLQTRLAEEKANSPTKTAL